MSAIPLKKRPIKEDAEVLCLENKLPPTQLPLTTATTTTTTTQSIQLVTPIQYELMLEPEQAEPVNLCINKSKLDKLEYSSNQTRSLKRDNMPLKDITSFNHQRSVIYQHSSSTSPHINHYQSNYVLSNSFSEYPNAVRQQFDQESTPPPSTPPPTMIKQEEDFTLNYSMYPEHHISLAEPASLYGTQSSIISNNTRPIEFYQPNSLKSLSSDDHYNHHHHNQRYNPYPRKSASPLSLINRNHSYVRSLTPEHQSLNSAGSTRSSISPLSTDSLSDDNNYQQQSLTTKLPGYHRSHQHAQQQQYYQINDIYDTDYHHQHSSDEYSHQELYSTPKKSSLGGAKESSTTAQSKTNPSASITTATTTTTAGGVSRHHCQQCGKSYSTYSGLTKHIQFHCVSTEGNQAKKEYSCTKCGKINKSVSALKMHIRTHTLPNKCHICGKAFSRPWLLQGHIRTHTGEKPFSCEHCHRAFADRSNLRAHLQTHSEVKKYSCQSCEKTFSRMSLLTKHQDGGCSGMMMIQTPSSSPYNHRSSLSMSPQHNNLILVNE